MRVLQPPEPLHLADGERTVFLAGSIELGTAEPWQDAFLPALRDTGATILNPRRAAWDASWVQSIENPVFREQVEWELAAQEHATVVVMYFSPATRSPVTLLELGLLARSGKLIVCCPAGFWRKGNVDVVCARHGVEQVADLAALAAAARRRLA